MDINSEFRKHFETLYKTDQASENETKDFLNKISLPSLTDEDEKIMEAELSEEVQIIDKFTTL